MEIDEQIETMCTAEMVRQGIIQFCELGTALIVTLPPRVATRGNVIATALSVLTSDRVWPSFVRTCTMLASFASWLYEMFKDRGLEFLSRLAERLDSLLERLIRQSAISHSNQRSFEDRPISS